MKYLISHLPHFIGVCFGILAILTTQSVFLDIANSSVEAYIKWHIRPNSIPYSLHTPETDPSQSRVLLEFVRQTERAGWTISQIERGWGVLKCESHFQWAADNPTSSALGVAQWISSTWKSKAPSGADRLNYQANIALFVQYFLKEPSHWKTCL